MMRLVFCAILCLLPAATADCPVKCICNRYKTTCWNSKLNGLPHGLVNSTKFVRVQNDKIPELNQAIISQALPTRLKELQLVSILLRKIKTLTFQNMELLEYLIITGNNINILDAGTFKGLHMLYKLDLSKNSISIVNPGAFEGLDSLGYLSMSHNKIKRLHQGIFNNMKSTQRFNLLQSQSVLDFSFNGIEYIEPGVFQNLTVFSHLNLEGCDEAPFLPGMFEGINGVKTLRMTNTYSYRNNQNNLTSLSKDVLKGISSLNILNFRDSGIVKVYNFTFESFNALSQLDLSFNYITNLRQTVFFGLSSLKMLTLYRNSINALPNFVFQGLQSLITLNIRDCRLQLIFADAFHGLFKVRFLDLSENNLSWLTTYIFSDLVNLKEVKLHGNNIKISDGLYKLKSLKYLDLQSVGYNNISNTLFQILTRLDDLKTKEIESINGQQVLRKLDIRMHMDKQNDTVEDKLHRMLQGVEYVHELKLTISGVRSTSQIGNFSKLQPSYIDISYNTLSLSSENSFKNQTSLTSLKIVRCRITTMEVGVFQELTSLANLNLSFSTGIELRYGIFLGLNNLKQLNLSFNEMDSLEVGTFFGLDNLKTLDIYGNEISVLGVGVFDGLNSIDTLNISQNSLEKLGEGVFGAICGKNVSSTCEMTYMSSYNCNVSHVLTTLRHLDLSHNDIQQIHPNTFMNCINLQILDLSHNDMLNLDTNFLHTSALRILNINKCGIKSLPIGIFRCTTKLSEIQLSFNKIRNINTTESFGHLLNLEKVNVLGNPISCDLQQQKMWQWLQDRSLARENNYKLNVTGTSSCGNDDIRMGPSNVEYNDSTPVFFKETKYNTYQVTFFNRYIQSIIFIMIFVSAFVGNSFLIYAFLSHSELRSGNNVCIVSMATAHLLFLILYTSLSYWDNSWNSTTLKLLIALKNFVVEVTILSILSMSLQKFLLLRTFGKPLEQYIRYHRRMTISLNLIIWGLAISTVILISFSSKQDMISSPENEYFKRISIIQLIVYCIIPFFVALSLESFNYLVLLENVSILQVECLGVSKDDFRKQFPNITMILTFVFIISFFPNFLMKILVAWSIVDISAVPFLHYLFSYLSFSNSVLNPIVIFTTCPKYQNALMKNFESRCEPYSYAKLNTGDQNMSSDTRL